MSMVPARGTTGGMIPADREAALWAEIKRLVEDAGLTYKAAQVRPLSLGSLLGENGWTLEIVWMAAGMAIAGPDDIRANWQRRWFTGANAVEIMAQARKQFRPIPVAIPAGPRVLNLRDFGIGGVKPRPWGPFDLPADVVNVDRRGDFGNPYHIGDADPEDPETALTRDRAIALFEIWAEARLAASPAWLDPLKGKRLACWCAPLRCHAEWYVRKLEERGW